MDDSPDLIAPARDPDMPDDALGLGLAAPEAGAKPMAASPYRVLARKYRPQNFAELIGQDAMVQTLGNAIKRERLAHAFLMTGVRGVGKTSTARLIAKALNCTGPDGQGGPTIDPCGVCEACVSIAEGRHIDVIEMDAASHTGVDDVREIIEAVRYAAVSARYKIYIIDEVHMLSKNAFNALLKTLEEPPAHVKFLFATTEVNKVPITVLSRCQRFDLKRIPAEKLAAHFGEICDKEAVTAEPEALMLVAQAAEGSVRDGLSILDQAIAHADMAVGEGEAAGAQVSAAQVREMLGLSDRAAVRRILGLILDGDAQAVLAQTREQYVLGVEPLATLAGLLREVHLLTLAKLGAPHDASLPHEAREEVEHRSDMLSFPQLHRLWQLLLKGHDEVSRASMPLEACEMALLRVIHAAAMPDPGELARILREGGAPILSATPLSASASDGSAPAAVASPVFPADFRSLVEALDKGGNAGIAATLHDVVRLVSYDPPRLEFQYGDPVHQGFVSELNDALFRLTGTRWSLAETAGEAQPSLYEQEQALRAAEDSAILESPLVKAALEAFPDALVEVDGRVLNVLNPAEVRSLSA